jgi:hypothetical protein
MNIKSKNLALFILLITLSAGCKKEWLDAKPNKALVVPTNVADLQALIDNTGTMNTQLPALSMVGDGDYYVGDDKYNSLGSPQEKGAYIWASTSTFYGGQPSSDWGRAYARILQTNVVLDGLLSIKIDDENISAYQNVKGSALFYRSLDYYNLSQQYCKPYDQSKSITDLGLPLRVSSNVNLNVTRSTVKQTYDQVINDLLQAVPLLTSTPLYPTRPSKQAAFGLLARVYLSQDNYTKAFLYADSCLQLQSGLMNFNELTPTKFMPFQQFNKEVIFHAGLGNYASASPVAAQIVDPDLYQSYDANDLRLKFYFVDNGDGKGNYAFQGSYFGVAIPLFGGIATDEMYLIRAECNARAGLVTAAMNDLNELLRNRYKTDEFSNLTAANADDALAIIIAERRKELCFRNLRWTDLRRLNKDPRFQTTLTRNLNGQTYTLPPNSTRYVLPIDPVEETLGGLQQNPR